MNHEVVLNTERLLLRPPVLEDAPDLQRLASAQEVAYNTLTIPHPYPDGAAEEWIRRQTSEGSDELVFAITLRDGGTFIGIIGLRVQREHDRGELGYWIAVPYWGSGYAVEAARAVIAHAFEALLLNKVFAAHFDRNPASGRVMQKLGMKHEGTLRQHHLKWGEYLDDVVYSILRTEWKGLRTED